MGAEPDRDPEGQRLARERAAMVETQLRLRGIRDERVLAAMGTVPRERFVPEFDRSLAYADAALPIDAGQSISQPYMVARMTELLAVRPGDRVLEIGTGSGYQAAILANLGARVLSFERHAELADEARRRLELLGFADAVEIRIADGSLGDPTATAFDGIVVTAAAPSIPGALLEQLAEGGRLVIPVGSRDRQQLVVATRHGDGWDQRSDGECVFVPLVGAGGWPE
jgi:protein-L-isoaspartate(D-aspartate) O-methyltransferase